jgi:exopolysaccharide production protein ExoZ
MKVLSIQVLRAAAAWMIVFHHYMQLGHNDKHSTIVGYFFINYGSFGIDIFFVVSGFVMFYTISQKNPMIGEFLVARVLRVTPAYWVATIVLILAALLFRDQFSWTDWSAKTLFLSMLYLPSENPSGIGTFPFLTVGWTLSLEMFFYLLLGLCLFFKGQWRFLVCGTLLLALPYLWPRDWVLATILTNTMMKEFVLGICVGYGYLKWQRLRDWAQSKPVVMFVPLIAASVLVISTGLPGSRALGATGVVAAGLCLENSLDRGAAGAPRFFMHLGDISYSTYLFHPIIIPLVFWLVGTSQTIANEAMLLICCCVSVYAVSRTSYRVVEQSRTVRQLGKLLIADRSHR